MSKTTVYVNGGREKKKGDLKEITGTLPGLNSCCSDKGVGGTWFFNFDSEENANAARQTLLEMFADPELAAKKKRKNKKEGKKRTVYAPITKPEHYDLVHNKFKDEEGFKKSSMKETKKGLIVFLNFKNEEAAADVRLRVEEFLKELKAE